MTEQADELVIEFKHPILNKAKDSITEITLCEPTAGQWREWDKLSGVEADIKAVAKVSGQPEFVIEQMQASQLVEGAAFIGRLLYSVRRDGMSE